MYNEHIDIVNGNQRHIKRILKLRGCSDETIQEVMEKIDTIIEHSGKLGRVFQRDKDAKYIKEANTKIWELQRRL